MNSPVSKSISERSEDMSEAKYSPLGERRLLPTGKMQGCSTCLFPGSFDPFTVGHANIVERGLKMFDKVVIGIGVNVLKTPTSEMEHRLAAIRALYEDNPHVSVEAYTDLTVDMARRVGATHILRGLRSVHDFEYERDIAAMNKRLSGIDTVLLFTEPEYQCVSSSALRELIRYGKDVSSFLPK